MNRVFNFGKDFVWGVATSAFQIEGAVTADNRQPSIWDTFCKTPGKIRHGDNADIACDHYHRYKEDIALLAELGIDSYRFSVSWPRLFSDGITTPNEKGFTFYDRLLDTLEEKNIAPWVTLYHWDLPQTLQDKGGWTSRDSIQWFTSFAEQVVSRYADRVQNWCLINEPSIMSLFGHGFGWHAPGLADVKAYGAAAHHINLAIATAYRSLKKKFPQLNIGSTWQICPFRARFDGDEIAAKSADLYWNRIHLDPFLKGAYPQEALPIVSPFIQAKDMEMIAKTCDFIGVQHYNPIYVTTPTEAPYNTFGFILTNGPENIEKNAAGWPVDPAGMKWVLDEMRDAYGNPTVYITENGYVNADEVVDGTIDDTRRISYMERHIAVAEEAFSKGSNLRGFFYWSMMDNFEWADGYDLRFGLIHVDYETQIRTPKASFRWYQQLIASSRAKKQARRA
jgi:beta-glucosidase